MPFCIDIPRNSFAGQSSSCRAETRVMRRRAGKGVYLPAASLRRGDSSRQRRRDRVEELINRETATPKPCHMFIIPQQTMGTRLLW